MITAFIIMNPIGFPSFEHYEKKNAVDLTTLFTILEKKLNITDQEILTINNQHLYLIPISKKSLLAIVAEQQLTDEIISEYTRAANGITHGDKLAIHSVVNSFNTPF